MWCDVGHSLKLKLKAFMGGGGGGGGWISHSFHSNLLVIWERVRESQTSLFDPRSFVGRNTSGQEQKFIYLTRATRGYRKHGISLRIQARSSRNQRSRF